MLRARNIAFFIDIDNVGIDSEHYQNVMDQLDAMGTVLTGVIYGAGERKHKDIYVDADAHGYKLARPMRVKRRGKKDFDNRIFVDVVDAVARANTIDAVCIVAQPTDLVYLYSFLRSRGIKVIALANGDEASNAFIDEVVDLGKADEAKPAPKKAPVKKAAAAPVEQPAPKAKQDTVDRTDELLREIEHLKSLAAEPAPAKEPVKEKPAPKAEKPVAEAEDTDELLSRIAEMKQPKEQPKAEEPAPAQKAAPQTSYTPQSDSDLIRRIEEIRRNNEGGDPDDLLEEIRKLLDME